MSVFLAENNNIIGFYDDRINTIPTGGVKLTDEQYESLLSACTRGATLAIKGKQPVALDWQGNVINLNTSTPDSVYSEPPSLKSQAESALQEIMAQAPSLTAMGEVFGPQTREYVQKLRAISNGTDTTSMTLPPAPSDPTA